MRESADPGFVPSASASIPTGAVVALAAGLVILAVTLIALWFGVLP